MLDARPEQGVVGEGGAEGLLRRRMEGHFPHVAGLLPQAVRLNGRTSQVRGQDRPRADTTADARRYRPLQAGRLRQGMTSSAIHALISVPTAAEARRIAHGFQRKSNIPQILGCIGGTHVPVLPPGDSFKEFTNREGWPSCVLQAVVDDTYGFWNINCKMPGGAHDAKVLKQSALFALAHHLPKEPREISRTTVNLFLLGDPAYPLLDWLIKDYVRSPNMTPEQESFNAYLSSARTTVEIAFGRLKSRWKVLLQRSDFHYTFTPHVVATCCALHNFCENESINPAWIDEAAVLEQELPQPGMSWYHAADCADGQTVRLALTEYLKSNFPLRRHE
ncbi:uncharacterized protein LOC133535159 isoform X2 [Nerophis ophidion]|uniref:uncharacterized protein LOC133535159 isoform X2 n=1 Tax=Nerophis ophidion TaxID=159077 RepID=UPI002ADF3B25|nr:uncharacterized protein LOC133535159 isoform X2 [Nerophis ophidion]